MTSAEGGMPPGWDLAVLTAYAAAVTQDQQGIRNAVGKVLALAGERGEGVSGALLAWARIAKDLVEDGAPIPPDCMYALESQPDIDTLPLGRRFVGRFVTAVFNDDTQAAFDLFYALDPVRDADALIDGCLGVLDIAGAAGRYMMKQKKGPSHDSL